MSQIYSIDPKLSAKLGYYFSESSQEFVQISFDQNSGHYFIQYGYVRVNGEARERVGSDRRVGNPEIILNQIDKLTVRGMTLREKPSSVNLRSIQEFLDDDMFINVE